MTAIDVAGTFSLAGKIAIVTGASSGLGVTFAAALAAAGADVALGARRVDKLAETRKRIEELGRRCIAVPTDVSVEGDCRGLVEETVRELGDVHVLINNAGIGHSAPAHREDPAVFTRVVDVNLVGAYYMAVAAAQAMMAAGHGGSIVNVASVMALSGSDIPQAGYSASKAGMVGMTRDLAMQWSARCGIRVNALAPGFFHSELTGPLLEGEIGRGKVLTRTPLGRVGQPTELIGPLLLLASGAGSYLTGITLPVDGGWTMH